MNQPLKVMIVDDHAAVREGFEAVIGLQSDLQVVASVASGPEAIQQFGIVNPDVVLMDLRLPEMDGLETLRTLRSRFPRARVVMVSSQEGDEAIHRALAAGALSYVFKKSSSSEVLAALRAAAQGGAQMSPEVSNRLAERADSEALSDREVEVLVQIGRGLSNKEIADALAISPNTVKNHINNIMNKLNASDRTHAVTIALQRGIIDLNV